MASVLARCAVPLLKPAGAARHWALVAAVGGRTRWLGSKAAQDTESLPLLEDKRAVVVGGGVVGTAVLYHLAKLGWKDSLLLERKVLTAGSTWHAAGGFHALNSDPHVSALQSYTINLYREIEALSEQSCGLHFTGGINFASTPERWEYLKNEWAKHRTMGIHSRLLTPQECKELCPIMDVSDVLGGLYDGNEGHLDCSGVTWAFAKSAQKLGASFMQQTKVESMRQRADRRWELVVAPDQNKPEGERRGLHRVLCDHVVNAGGLWAREVGKMSGVHLPLLPMQHHYVISEPIPALAECKEIPMCIDLDGESYLRGERGGVLLGVYEKDCRSWAEDATPWSYAENDLLEPDLDRIEPQMAQSHARYPALNEVGLRTIVNGPFTFAPDGNPLVGPVQGTGLAPPGITNYWVACAVMAGFAQGAGVGLTLAEWMVKGEPTSYPNVFAMDVARYGAWASKAYTLPKSQENYTRRFRISYPNEELPVGRGIKQTPVYDMLAKDGAVFGVSYGMEYPKYFSRVHNHDTPETPSFHRSNAFATVGEEVAALRGAVGMMETGTFSKYEVTGPGARAWLDQLLACKVPKTGRMCLAPMLSPTGRLMGDLTLMSLGAERFWLVGSGQLQGFHMRWFQQHLDDEQLRDVAVRNVTDEQLGFAISGPNSRKLLAEVVGDAALVTHEAFRFMDVKEMDVGITRAVVARVSVTGELGYEVTAPAVQMHQLYSALHRAGESLGLRNVGGYALTSARLEKGFGSWGREYTPEFTPRMSGLQRFVALDKKSDFVGKAAVAKEVAQPRKPDEWQLCLVTVHGGAAQTSDAWGYEPLWALEEGKEPRYCGYTTSGAFGHHVKQSIAAAYIDTAGVEAITQGRAKLQLWLLGEPLEARLQKGALYDESGSRMLS